MTKSARCTAPAVLLILMTVIGAGTALAQNGRDPIDLRAGITSWNHLSQIHLGLGFDLGEMWPGFSGKPNVEIGFGDDWTILTINGDLIYRFTELTTPPWCLYAGGGLALNYFDRSDFGDDTDLGLNAVVGLTNELNNGHTLLMEIRLGLMDSPEFKFTMGFSLF